MPVFVLKALDLSWLSKAGGSGSCWNFAQPSSPHGDGLFGILLPAPKAIQIYHVQLQQLKFGSKRTDYSEGVQQKHTGAQGSQKVRTLPLPFCILLIYIV